MILNRKKMDEIEDFCDFEGEQTNFSDSDEPQRNENISWRRVLIEKAAQKVRQAQSTTFDMSAKFNKGQLIFEPKMQKFARIADIKNGAVKLNLISGGQNIITTKTDDNSAIQMQAKVIEPVLKAASLKKTATKEKPLKSKLLKAKKEIKISKGLPVKTKAFNMSKSAAKIPISTQDFSIVLPKGAITDPIADPNGYIKQNFSLLNNKQLAQATGLSEHTVRRKLGEWGLKRKK